MKGHSARQALATPTGFAARIFDPKHQWAWLPKTAIRTKFPLLPPGPPRNLGGAGVGGTTLAGLGRLRPPDHTLSELAGGSRESRETGRRGSGSPTFFPSRREHWHWRGGRDRRPRVSAPQMLRGGGGSLVSLLQRGKVRGRRSIACRGCASPGCSGWLERNERSSSAASRSERSRSSDCTVGAPRGGASCSVLTPHTTRRNILRQETAEPWHRRTSSQEGA